MQHTISIKQACFYSAKLSASTGR